jgi:hypothetical protein
VSFSKISDPKTLKAGREFQKLWKSEITAPQAHECEHKKEHENEHRNKYEHKHEHDHKHIWKTSFCHWISNYSYTSLVSYWNEL